MGTITANGVDVHYELERTSEGAVVTLSHALGVSSRMWRRQATELGDRWRVLRYDARGHGESGVPEGPYTLDELVEDAKHMLDGLGIDKTHFVGLSMGGMIGQLFALRHPDRLHSLVLCDTTSEVAEEAKPNWDERIRLAREQGMEPHVEPTLQRWLTAPYRERHPEVADEVRAWLRATDPRGYIGCCHAIRELNLTEQLERIRVPTLVLVGADDPGTPPDVARRLHERIPGSQMHVIESAAHLSNVEQPETFNRLLRDFLVAHDP